jgi:nitrogenase molybdenum-iron protein alpha/beta subunit
MDGGKFFGAFRASSGITDAVVLNHVPVGCNWGAGMFKSFSSQSDIRNACTVMHEREIVFGGEESLREALIRADRLYDAPLILVVAGDVPSIIGDDIEAVVGSVSLKKDVIWMEAAGFRGSMRSGYEDALINLVPVMAQCDLAANSVNFIGFCPDDFKVEADLREIKRMMTNYGVTINSIISNCSYEELKRAPAAELNVVIGQGTELAKQMKDKFGIPYIEVGYPYGLRGSWDLIDAVSDHMGLGKDLEREINLHPLEKIYLYLNDIYGTPASVIGDFHAKPMADFLRRELGFDIEVLSTLDDDYNFEEQVRTSNSSILFGTSFEQELAKDMRIPLVRFSYPVFDQVCIYEDAPYAGLRGAVCLIESVLNSVMGFEDKLADLELRA